MRYFLSPEVLTKQAATQGLPVSFIEEFVFRY